MRYMTINHSVIADKTVTVVIIRNKLNQKAMFKLL